MTFKWRRIVLVAAAIILLAASCVVFMVLTAKRNAPSQQEIIAANWVEANGVATRTEYIKAARLKNSAGGGRALNEQEVDWLLAFANDPRFQGERRAQRWLYASGPLIFTNVKRLSVAERSKVYDFAVSLLLTPNHNDVATQGDIQAGCRILSNMGDKRAIPLLKPLLGSSNQYVRRSAANALDRFGIEIPPSDDL